MERLTAEQVHDKVMGEVRMYLDSLQMQEIDDYCDLWGGALATGWRKNYISITIYFDNGKYLTLDRWQ